ncbi:MAG: hybrid sensor histidine kinase/response regulator [Rhodobacterales bacterium]
MNTAVDFNLLVSVASLLTLVSVMIVYYLLRTTTEDLRPAVHWYAGSTLFLVIAALGVLSNSVVPYALTAFLIITGAHFGIVLAYATFRQIAGAPLRWRPVAIGSALVCLIQGALALSDVEVVVLMLTASLINGPLALVAGLDLGRRFRTANRAFLVLVMLPFLSVAFSYLLRLAVIVVTGDTNLIMISTAGIAFILGVVSMIWGFTLIIHRETELNQQLKYARRQAVVLSQQKARFFAQMNHELRTPLNGLLGLAELLRPHVRKGEGESLLRELQSSGELLLSIVNEVLDYSKAEAGKVQLEILPMDLEEVLENAAAQYRRVAASKSVSLSLQVLPADMPPVLGDPTRINQVFHNLLSNALKFTRSGEIRVTAERGADDLVEFTVSDTGIGMTKEQLDVLFVPFQQASADTTRRYGGTGLGMSIVKMLVETMDGSLHVESELGRGTSITFSLPLPEAPKSGLTKGKTGADTERSGSYASLEILCADDDPINRLVLQALLESYDVHPVMAEDGYEALSLVGTRHFDAYVIDISMPGMDGVETLAALRAADHRSGDDMPMAIAATANVMSEDVDNYLSEGFDAHLPKPIRRADVEALLQTMRDRTALTA